jgi:signal transduction histidine kinase
VADFMVFGSRPIRTRLAVLCGCLALLAAGVTYLLPRAWIAAGLGLVAVAGGWLGWLLAGRTVRRVTAITAAARGIDASHLHTRVGRAGPGLAGPGRARDEVAELADTLDAMLDRLERACVVQRRFFADAVEAMKAPMAQQRALVEGALDRAGTPGQLDQLHAALLEVTERQERLIDELLTLARSEGAITAPVPVELADIAYRVSDGLEREARRAGIELRVSAGPARTPGDPVLLERLARNLLQNAVRYNTADGWVRVATGTDGDTVHLIVANTGPVVPTGEVPALFEPFRRLAGCAGPPEPGRNGPPEPGCAGPGGLGLSPAGLGLSIVRSVAQAHGGRVSAAPRDGGGLVVEVTLPAQ